MTNAPMIGAIAAAPLSGTYTIHETIVFPNGMHAGYSIVCKEGEAPRVNLNAHGLTLDDEEALHAAIIDAVDRFNIPCRCGLSWLEHSSASPHQANSGDCRVFTAASPVRPESAE